MWLTKPPTGPALDEQMENDLSKLGVFATLASPDLWRFGGRSGQKVDKVNWFRKLSRQKKNQIFGIDKIR